MAITEAFIKSFEAFVERYKIAAAGYSLVGVTTVWTETDYELIHTQLSALLIGMKSKPDWRTEYDIIAFLAIISAAKRNAHPWFTSLFQEFMSKSNTESCNLAFAFNFSNDVQKVKPIDMIAGLQQAITQTKQSYETQLQVVHTQLQTLTDENEALQKEVAALRQQKSDSTSTTINMKRVKELIQETSNALNLMDFTPTASSSTTPVSAPIAATVKPSTSALPIMFTPPGDVGKKAAPPPPPAPKPVASSNQSHIQVLRTAIKGRYVEPEPSFEEKKNSASTSITPS